MPFRLLKFGFLRRHPEPQMFRAPERLRPGYHSVIIGGGNGLAIAYRLARDRWYSECSPLLRNCISGAARQHVIPLWFDATI